MKNHDLQLNPNFSNMVHVDNARKNLVNKIMDQESLQSPSQPNNTLSHEELKNSVKREDYFINKLTSSNTGSHDDLHATSEQNISSKQRLEGDPNMIPSTTPLSAESQAIKIEISGKPEDGQDPRLQSNPEKLYQTKQEVVGSPLSVDSATYGIKMGSMSLSSSTSKDGHSHVLPHMGMGMDDPSMSQGPDATFGGGHGKTETTANSVNVNE